MENDTASPPADPNGVDPGQAWFWAADWQAGERQASAEIAAGGIRVFDDPADLFADLDDDPGRHPA